MPTDESKIELPAWLPWATTACLAALVACLGELWVIEKERSQLIREDAALSQTALKAAENQLEAERIVSAREGAGLRAIAGPQVALLLAPGGSLAPKAAFGVVDWDPAARRGRIRLSGLPVLPPERDYQLWLDGQGPGYPADCGAFHGPADDDGAGISISVAGAVGPGCRFLLVDGVKGGGRTLAEAGAHGSIVLATLPIGENISHR